MSVKNAFSREYVPVINWAKDPAKPPRKVDPAAWVPNISASIVGKKDDMKGAKIRRGGR